MCPGAGFSFASMAGCFGYNGGSYVSEDRGFRSCWDHRTMRNLCSCLLNFFFVISFSSWLWLSDARRHSAQPSAYMNGAWRARRQEGQLDEAMESDESEEAMMGGGRWWNDSCGRARMAVDRLAGIAIWYPTAELLSCEISMHSHYHKRITKMFKKKKDGFLR